MLGPVLSKPLRYFYSNMCTMHLRVPQQDSVWDRGIGGLTHPFVGMSWFRLLPCWSLRFDMSLRMILEGKAWPRCLEE